MVMALDQREDSIERGYLGLGAHLPADDVMELHVHPELHLTMTVDNEMVADFNDLQTASTITDESVRASQHSIRQF